MAEIGGITTIKLGRDGKIFAGRNGLLVDFLQHILGKHIYE
jgi:hypothetical protein